MILFKIDKSSEVRFYYTILLSSLSVSLGIKRDRKSLFDAEEVAKQ